MNCETKCPAIRQVMFPKDTNPSGNIFGGIILSHIDVAGAIAARLHSKHRMVTVCMKEVVFKKPVKVGDILTCWTDVVAKGRTSVTVKIKVEAERHGEIIHVTDGEAIYVAVDGEDRPIALDSAPTADTTTEISPAPVPTAAPSTDTAADKSGKCKKHKGKKKDKKDGKKKNKKVKKNKK
jgi:acyl-CoA thioesterase YciA